MVYFYYLFTREGNWNEYNNEKYTAGWMCDVTLVMRLGKESTCCSCEGVGQSHFPPVLVIKGLIT